MYTLTGFRICLPLIAVGFVTISTVISPGVIAQSLSSTLHNGQFTCVGSEVIFTCMTRGSTAIAWISDEYIGLGELIFVANSDSQGDQQSSQANRDTIATLISQLQEDDQGTIVLVSTLRIIALAEPQTASVTCAHTDSGNRAAANFQVIGGVPAMPQNVVAVQIRRTTRSCVVHTLWDWQNMTEYQVSANGTEMSGVSKASVETTNGTMVSSLFSTECAAHVISVTATNVCGLSSTSLNLTLDQMPQHLLAELHPEPATDPTEIVTAVGNDATETTNLIINASQGNSESALPIVIGVFVALFIFLLAIIITLLVLVVYRYYQAKSKKTAVTHRGNQQDDVDESEKKENVSNL